MCQPARCKCTMHAVRGHLMWSSGRLASVSLGNHQVQGWLTFFCSSEFKVDHQLGRVSKNQQDTSKEGIWPYSS